MAAFDITMTWSTPVTGDVAQCTFSVDDTSPPTAPLAVAALVLGAWTAVGHPILNEEIATAYTLVSIKAEEIAIPGGPTGIAATLPVAVAGTQSATPLPPNCTYLLRKQTGVAVGGRNFQGRLYMPGTYESAIDGAGNLSAGLYSGLVTRAANFLDDLDNATIPMVLHDVGYTVLHPVAALGVKPTIATQRRRLVV